jgi:hypothetical protein
MALIARRQTKDYLASSGLPADLLPEPPNPSGEDDLPVRRFFSLYASFPAALERCPSNSITLLRVGHNINYGGVCSCCTFIFRTRCKALALMTL